MLRAAIVAGSMAPVRAPLLPDLTGKVPADGRRSTSTPPSRLAVRGCFRATWGARIVYGLGRECAARELGSYRLERSGHRRHGEVWRLSTACWLAPRPSSSYPAFIRQRSCEYLSREAVHRFEREAQVTALSSAIAAYRESFDFGEADNGAFYYAMELPPEGLDADRLVRRFGPLPARRADYLLRQVWSPTRFRS